MNIIKAIEQKGINILEHLVMNPMPYQVELRCAVYMHTCDLNLSAKAMYIKEPHQSPAFLLGCLFDQPILMTEYHIVRSDFTLMYMSDLTVRKDLRGIGIGKWFIQRIISKMPLNPSSITCNRIELESTRESYGFWKSLGFKKISNAGKNIRMRKRL